MSLVLYDTQTRSKRAFVPNDDQRVTMYVCGPTVYDFAHIGNFRPAVVFDVVFRVLRHQFGAENVIYASNFTDVDDKINKRANEERIDIGTLTERYIKAYNEDSKALGNLPVTFQPRATASMDAIIAMIERLLDEGSAYSADGHVLFDTRSFAEYGEFSRRPLDELIEGARVEIAPYKRDPRDFVLWKPSKEGEPSWPSPWGNGRPGWHIECTAMIEQSLGLPIDIHGGGADLIFPHHENEIAQGKCCGGSKDYSRFWMHNGMLNMDQAKMSKSVGKVQTAHNLLEHFPGEVLRWGILSGHYRAPLEWQETLLIQSKRSLDRLYGALWRNADIEAEHVPASDAVIAALLDDINTPRAFAELFSLAGQLETAKPKEKALAKGRLLASAQLMGFLDQSPTEWFQSGVSKEEQAEIESLLKERSQARSEKNWAEADRIRDELSARKIEVMDGNDSVRWRYSSE